MEPGISKEFFPPLEYSLCEKCIRLFSHAGLDIARNIPAGADEYSLPPVHHTKTSLEEAAMNGCGLCKLFLHSAKTDSKMEWTSLSLDAPLHVLAYGWRLLPEFGRTRDGKFPERVLPKDVITQISLNTKMQPFSTLLVVAQPGLYLC